MLPDSLIRLLVLLLDGKFSNLPQLRVFTPAQELLDEILVRHGK